jgi:uncharacterized damage-inducible protein DinB
MDRILLEKRGMKLTELFLAELDREVPRSRRALEQVPPDSRDWKPHEKSMAFGYLADMVATIPSWLVMIVNQDQLDIAPQGGQQFRPPLSKTSQEFVAALEKAASDARSALEKVDDEFLTTRWQLLAGGKVVADMERHEMLRETINHWAHHRGQMTVYLRLMGAKVPSIYGPSADDTTFA